MHSTPSSRHRSRTRRALVCAAARTTCSGTASRARAAPWDAWSRLSSAPSCSRADCRPCDTPPPRLETLATMPRRVVATSPAQEINARPIAPPVPSRPPGNTAAHQRTRSPASPSGAAFAPPKYILALRPANVAPRQPDNYMSAHKYLARTCFRARASTAPGICAHR